MIRSAFLLLLGIAVAPCLCARTIHVNVAGGNDANDGASPARALRTIQRAADLVQAGDEVVIAPGVYFERVRLPATARGEVGRPIVFRADRIGRDRVVLTGANRALREGTTGWERVDAALGLYAVAFVGNRPARVTYDHVDLFPYGSLKELKTFTTVWQGGSPGPRHGFYHDAQAGRLYVRLHASGRYGEPDPNKRTMAVSPRPVSGRLFTLRGKGPAHVIIEGITFETPGDTAIHTEASAVTIRDCWFFGTPYAVRGTNKHREPGPDDAADIVIEHCEFTELSTWNDAVELLEAANLQPGQRMPWHAIWHRKTTGSHGLPPGTKNYENGITACMGRGWIIRHNYIHDIFEGLAGDGMTRAVDARIHDNIFARICDNAIETEDHSRNVHITRNLFLDVFEPFSWQPGGGPPWPGPLFFYQNVVANTPGPATLWQPAPHGGRGVFKMGISLKNWRGGRNADVPQSPLAAPPPGLLFFNNTIWFPGGRLFTRLGSRDVPIENVLFARNLVATDYVSSTTPENDLQPGFFAFRQNLVAPATPGQPGLGELVAGPASDGGRTFADAATIGWQNPASGDFRLRPDSPANAADNAGSASLGSDIPPLPALGALQPGDTWFPPRVGPRVTPTR